MKRHKSLVKLFNLLMALYTILSLYRLVILKTAIALREPHQWCLSEFLINYQAGYVRRGLVGEIILQLTKTFSDFDPRWFIGILCLTSFVLLLLIIFYFVKANKLCWWALPLNICVFGARDIIRKDYICALLVFILLSCYKNISRVPLKCLSLCIIVIISLNVHECFFFMIIPFIIFLLVKDPIIPLTYKVSTIILFSLTMITVCYHKGDIHYAEDIYISWKPYFLEFTSDKIPETINSLSWTTFDTIYAHFKLNFLKRSYFIYGFYSKPLIWILTLYVIPNLLYFKTARKVAATKACSLISIMIFQFCSLFPMFTLLSCDGSRICFYWTITSLLIFFCFPSAGRELFPICYQKFIKRVANIIFTPHSRYVSMLAALFLCISPSSTKLIPAFACSVVGSFGWLIAYLTNFTTKV